MWNLGQVTCTQIGAYLENLSQQKEAQRQSHVELSDRSQLNNSSGCKKGSVEQFQLSIRSW